MKETIVLIPAYKPEALLIPLSIIQDKSNISKEINVHIELPKIIRGKVKVGTEYGYIEYMVGNITLQKVPLIAQQTVKQANPFIYLADLLAQFVVYF